MKRSFSINQFACLALLVTISLVWSGCKKSSVEEAVPNNPIGGGQYTPDQISARITIPNALSVKGQIAVNAALADLKIDKDTIFSTQDIPGRISILYPGTGGFTGASSIYIQVKGAESFYDVKPESKEFSDSLGVLYLGFDTKDIVLPLSFEVELAPHDAAGNVIDRFKRKVVIEKSGVACDPVGAGGTSKWNWNWTAVNGERVMTPAFGQVSLGTTNGCCFEGETVDCIANNIPESDWRKLENIKSFIWQESEQLVLNSNKTMTGNLVMLTQSLDYGKSDFCSGTPAYSQRRKDNQFGANWEYLSASNEIKFSDVKSRLVREYVPSADIYVEQYDLVYIGQHNTYKLISCHFLLENSASEGGGQNKVRLFERQDNPGWKD